MNKQLLKESLLKIKPPKTFWGISSVILFFIVPDVISFIWGDEIKSFFDAKAELTPITQESYIYTKFGELLSEGSWFNIALGVAILIWAFF